MSESFDMTGGALDTWEHAGLACMVKASPLGALNGYVKLSPTHPDFGREYDDIDVEVHGGLTYGCDKAGWVGFDTLHAGDWWEPSQLPEAPGAEYAKLSELAQGWASEANVWTRERLRAEVDALAETLSAKGATQCLN